MNNSAMEHKIQSLEHSLEFLQEQHAATLNGLQEEISKLQSKCSSLIHQLAESGTKDDQRECEQTSSLEEKLRNSQLRYQKLKETLENREERILMLEAQSKSKEQKYVNELKHYQSKAAELQTELEHKVASIAYLTTKLQHSKVKDSVLPNETVVPCGKQLTPSPPRGNSGRQQHERKNVRCYVNAPTAGVTGIVVGTSAFQENQDSAVLDSTPNIHASVPRIKTKMHSLSDPPRPALGLSQSRRDRDLILMNRPKPTDYEDFIKMNHSEEVLTKPVIEPLPPITPRSGKPSRPQRGKTYTNKNAVTCTSSTGEVETVIVESSLPSPDRPYGKVQDMT